MRIVHSTVRLIDVADPLPRHPPHRYKSLHDQLTIFQSPYKSVLIVEGVRMVDRSDPQVPPIIL